MEESEISFWSIFLKYVLELKMKLLKGWDSEDILIVVAHTG